MAHAYRVRPAPQSPATTTRSVRIALLALTLCVAIGAVSFAFLSRRSQSSSNARAIATMQTVIVTGMSRPDCYRVLRELGLTAVNPAFSAWTKNRFGVWFESDAGAWPQPGDRPRPNALTQPLNPAHPEVTVKLTTAEPGGCGMATIEQILFDRYDRVKHVAYSEPYWTCNS